MLKTSFTLLLSLTLISTLPAGGANSDVGTVIVRQFGEAQLRNVVLVTAAANASDPIQWRVYSRDPYRADELLMTVASKTSSGWDATPAGAGRLLQRVPRQCVDFNRLKVDAKAARRLAKQAAGLAQRGFVQVFYQLAANEETGSPEWGLALLNEQMMEVGFIVISAETGAVTHQDWSESKSDTGVAAAPKSRAEREGEEAARKVKQGVRKAWNWTEEAGRKTGSFFREIFR